MNEQELRDALARLDASIAAQEQALEALERAAALLAKMGKLTGPAARGGVAR